MKAIFLMRIRTDFGRLDPDPDPDPGGQKLFRKIEEKKVKKFHV
jgi:hypothetical protein